MEHRIASDADLPLLAAWNAELIRDEDHSNPMTVPELEARMREWLGGPYTAVIFTEGGAELGYALFRPDEEVDSGVFLRHLFVDRGARRRGVGRRAMELLRGDVWAPGARVRLEVLVGNGPGRAFWSALGFREHAIVLDWDQM